MSSEHLKRTIDVNRSAWSFISCTLIDLMRLAILGIANHRLCFFFRLCT